MARPRVNASRGALFAMIVALCIVFLPYLSAPSYADDKDWDSYTAEMTEKIQQIPDQYAAGDLPGVETSIRQAYYEVYQVSGMEAEIDHRLGEDRNDAFVADLLAIRDMTQDGASQEDVQAATDDVIALLESNVADLKKAPRSTTNGRALPPARSIRSRHRKRPTPQGTTPLPPMPPISRTMKQMDSRRQRFPTFGRAA